MKISGKSRSFEPCPEFTGKAVCVDVTPTRKQQSQYGERDVFKLVFEVDLEKGDGSRFCVWSNSFTPSLNEKANLRKFVRGWLGRDLTAEELQEFDTETLVGRPAHLVVVQEHRNGEIYANIMACLPDKSPEGEALKPSGRFVRVKDRPSQAGATSGSGYRRMEGLGTSRLGESDGNEHALVKIHVGRCKGLELRDLAPEQVQALVEKWLPSAKANPKPLADDRRLMAALEWWQAEHAVTATEEDNIPY